MMELQIGELSGEHQKYNRNTHTHTHTHARTHARTHAHTQSRKDSQLRKLFKAYMSPKYILALKGVLIFC